ncbi:MAG: Arc family DNA binding domain-containing protein [Bacteroidales bacterium]|nr:Arc family DNA binding domain-containing protein [Bacteroidales bacterium]
MSKKKVFMLRLNPDVYAALEKWAADEFRSVNGQVEWILNNSLKDRGRSPNKTEKNATQKTK